MTKTTKNITNERRYNWTVRENFAMKLLKMDSEIKQKSMAVKSGVRITKQLILETMIDMATNSPKVRADLERALFKATK